MVEMMTMKLMTKVMGNDEGYSYNHTTLPIQVLYLSTNSLLEIPHKLPKHLEHLTLDNNQISQLPKGSLSRTQRLRRLMLQRNKIGMTKRYVCVKLKIPPPPPPSPSPPSPAPPTPTAAPPTGCWKRCFISGGYFWWQVNPHSLQLALVREAERVITVLICLGGHLWHLAAKQKTTVTTCFHLSIP